MSDTKLTRARRLVDYKLQAEHTAEAAKIAKRDFEDQEQAFWESMADAGESSMTLDLGEPYGKVLFVQQMTVRAIVRHKAVVIDSLTEAGLADALIDPVSGIRQKAQNDYMKDWLKTGEPIPHGLDFTVTRYVTITIKPD
jgi:hypothetical protein